MKNRVLIIGAGLGGMATGLRLAKKGFEVIILEKNQTPGGRLNQIQKDGFTFDTGPSFFSMSYEFDEFVKDCGIEMPFEFVELDPLYSVNIKGSDKIFHLYKDLDKLAAQFEEYEPDFRERMNKYLKKSGNLFHDTVDLVIKRNFNSIFDYFITLARVNPTHLSVLTRNFWKQVTRYFDSHEARQIISLVSFFLGKTPFDTMAIYTLLSYTEFKHDGYYNVKGGMYNIVKGLNEELEKSGVKVILEKEIVDFKSSKGEVEYFIDSVGDHWQADIYIVNSDAAYFRGKVLKDPKYTEAKLKKMDWTMGYLTFYVGVDIKIPQINHHNYYLGGNYEEYAQKVAQGDMEGETPYYYVNVLSKHNNTCAPEGCESLFFVCPAPNLLVKSDWSDKEIYFKKIIDDFAQRNSIKDFEKHIVSRTILTPQEWQDTFNLYKGGGLGLSHTFDQIGAFRPSNFDKRFKNLFYVGASTVPGAGLPMAIISSKLTTERVLELNR